MHRVVLPAAVGGGDQRGRKTHRCVTGAQLQCFGDAHAAIAAGQHGADRRQVGLADAGHVVALQAGDVLQGFGEIAGIEQGQRPGLRGVRRGDARIQFRREVAQAVGIGSGVDRGASQGFHARDHRRVGGEQAQGVDAQARGVVAGIDAVPAVAPGQGRRASGIERMAEQRRAGERRGREQQRGGEQCHAGIIDGEILSALRETWHEFRDQQGDDDEQYGFDEKDAAPGKQFGNQARQSEPQARADPE